MLETIQGENGIKLPPPGYLKEVRQLCTEKNILLIIDEVQTGTGRTGKFFSYQHEDILPDIVTVAKGIANGLPLGATLCTKEIGDLMIPGSHGSTFGGNPVAIAAANTVVNLLDDKILENISELGHYFLSTLTSIASPFIKEIRGKGLMIGIEFTKDISAKKVAAELLQNGFITCTAGENVLRILPPYLITKEDISIFAEKLELVLSEPAGKIN
jgi:acetylornithine/succinyldiaminopimelate/putrescine aminotransferase